MSGPVIGRATVEVGADASGFPADVQRQASGPLQSIGRNVASAFGTVFKTGLATVGTAAAAGMGVALSGGFSRLTALDDATYKLKALGHEGDALEGIMKNAENAVLGTAFGLDEAAGLAGVFVAAGIKPGKELEGVLTTLANTSSVAGTSLQEMGQIMQGAAARGRITGHEMAMLANRGVPALSILADHLGLTTEEIEKMVSNGEISFDTFVAAMDGAMGEAAVIMGQSGRAMVSNLVAALSRLGADALAPLLAGFKMIAPPLIAAVSNIQKQLQPVFESWGDAMEPLFERIADWFTRISEMDFSGLSSAFSGLSALLVPLAGLLVGMFGPLMARLPIVGALFASLTGPVGAIIGLFVLMWQSSEVLRNAVTTAFEEISTALGGSGETMQWLSGVIGELAVWLGDNLGAAIAFLTPLIVSLIEGFNAIGQEGDTVAAVGESLREGFERLGPIFEQLGGLIPALLTALIDLTVTGFSGLVTALGWISENMDWLIALLPAIIAGFVAWRLASMGVETAALLARASLAAMAPVLMVNQVLMLANNLIAIRFRTTLMSQSASIGVNTAAHMTNNAALRAKAVAASVAAVQTRILTIAMRALPFMWIATAVMAAVAALTWFFTSTEMGQGILAAFRDIAVGAWERIRDLGLAIWPQIQAAFEGFVNFVRPIAEQIGTWFSAGWDMIVAGATAVGETLSSFFGGLGDGASESANGVMGSFQDTFDRLSAGAAELRDTVLPFFQSIGETLGETFSEVREILAPAFESVVEAAAPLIPMFVETGQAIMEAIQPLGEMIVNEILPTLAELYGVWVGMWAEMVVMLAPLIAGIVEELVPALVDFAQGILPQVIEALQALVSGFVPVITTIAETVAVFIGQLIPVLAMIISAILPVVATVIEVLVPALLMIIGTILQVATQVIAVVLPFVAQMIATFLTLVAFVIEFLIPIIEQILQVVVTVFEAIVPVVMAALDILMGVITTVMGLISGDWAMVWEGIKQILSATWDFIVAAVTGAWDILLSVLQLGLTVLQALWSVVWTAISAVASAVWGMIVSAVTSAWETLSGWVSSGLSALSAIWSSIWSAISAAASAVWSAITGAVTSAWSALSGAVSSGLSALSSLWSSIWNAIRAVAAAVWAGIQAAVSVAWNALSSLVSSGLSVLSGIWSSIWGTISSFLSTTWDNITSTVSSAIDRVVEAVSSGLDTAISFVSELPGRVLDVLGNLGSYLYDSGAALINGFKEGIVGAFGAVRDAVSGGLERVRNLLPFSPAKEGPFSGRGYTTHSGKALVDDFAKGIEGQEDGAVRAMRGVAEKMRDSFDPEAYAPRGGINGMMGGNNLPRTPDTGGGSAQVTPVPGGGIVVQGPLIAVDSLTVDSDDRVRQVSQDLYTRAMRQGRADGKVNLGGSTR